MLIRNSGRSFMSALPSSEKVNEALAKCSCTIEYDDGDPKAGGSAFIHHCPLCKAAGALLEALETVKRDWLSSIDRVRFAAMEKVDAAIAATGAG